jgi:hypothetical protein
MTTASRVLDRAESIVGTERIQGVLRLNAANGFIPLRNHW